MKLDIDQQIAQLLLNGVGWQSIPLPLGSKIGDIGGIPIHANEAVPRGMAFLVQDGEIVATIRDLT